MVALRRPVAVGSVDADAGSLSALHRRIFAALPYLFLVFALVSGVFIALVLPPFMGPDEPNHTYRASLLTLGRLNATRVEAAGPHGGGPVDRGLVAAATVLEPLRFHPELKATPAHFAAARPFGWTGSKVPTDFQNTAIYGPVLYLPQAAGLAVGRALRLNVLDSLRLARLANVLACALIGFLALKVAGGIRIVLFALLLLPMSTFLFGTVTQDGLLMVLTALGCALVSRGVAEDRSLEPRELWGAAACFALVAMAKPPLAVFGLTLLATRYDGPGPRWPAALMPLVLGALWSACMSYGVWVTDGGEARQAANLLAHPAVILPLAWNTLVQHGPHLAGEFIGVLGWLDTVLPGPYHLAAWAVLALVVGLCCGGVQARGWRALPPVAGLVAASAAAAVFAALYLQWTPFAYPTVQGVQGRYLIPIAIVAALALERAHGFADKAGLRTWALAAVALFPLVSFWIVNQAVLLRYFGP